MTKMQKNIRMSDLTARKLADLVRATGMSQTEIISIAIDRMYTIEITGKKKKKK